MSVYITEHSQAIKDLGNGKVGGYCVVYGNPESPDLTGDFFTQDTKFYIKETNELPVFYAHSFDEKLGDRVLGQANFKQDEVGVWVEAQLDLRDDYEKAVYELVKQGKLGWSTGAPSHLVRREKVKQAYYIKSWPIAEVSLTPTPAEPQTFACIKEISTRPNGPSIVDEGESSSKSLAEHFDSCLLELKALTERLDSVRELRENKGRKAFSQKHLEMLQALTDSVQTLKESAELAQGLLRDPEEEARAQEAKALEEERQQLFKSVFENIESYLKYEE